MLFFVDPNLWKVCVKIIKKNQKKSKKKIKGKNFQQLKRVKYPALKLHARYQKSCGGIAWSAEYDSWHVTHPVLSYSCRYRFYRLYVSRREFFSRFLLSPRDITKRKCKGSFIYIVSLQFILRDSGRHKCFSRHASPGRGICLCESNRFLMNDPIWQ